MQIGAHISSWGPEGRCQSASPPPMSYHFPVALRSLNRKDKIQPFMYAFFTFAMIAFPCNFKSTNYQRNATICGGGYTRNVTGIAQDDDNRVTELGDTMLMGPGLIL
jgi:hypothetical protein